ncbi:MAG TPA: hypothetical protein VGV35_00835 [Bryobacteraceae bacterium]|nr:hypothetical protein [Bryobacteraceae bacterium]
MLRKLGLPAVVLGTVLSMLSPAAALARDRDDRGHERGERREWREREFRRGPRFSFSYGPSYTYSPYASGYYDQWGYWHPYGHYDRWGRFHPY